MFSEKSNHFSDVDDSLALERLCAYTRLTGVDEYLDSGLELMPKSQNKDLLTLFHLTIKTTLIYVDRSKIVSFDKEVLVVKPTEKFEPDVYLSDLITLGYALLFEGYLEYASSTLEIIYSNFPDVEEALLFYGMSLIYLKDYKSLDTLIQFSQKFICKTRSVYDVLYFIKNMLNKDITAAMIFYDKIVKKNENTMMLITSDIIENFSDLA